MMINQEMERVTCKDPLEMIKKLALWLCQQLAIENGHL